MIQGTRNQSIMLSLPSNQSANHAILTFQPDSASAAVYNPAPYLDAYSSISFPVMARIREILLSCVLSEWHHSYTRESDAAYSAEKGGRFLPSKNASYTIRAQFCSEAAFHSSNSSIWFEAPCSIRSESPP